MSAYTEKNFNACLDHILAIRSHRDSALRIADAVFRLLEEDYHDQMCDCGICLLRGQFETLKVDVIAYQKSIQEEKKNLK